MKIVTFKYKFERNQQVSYHTDNKRGCLHKTGYIAEESGIIISVNNDDKKNLDYSVKYNVIEKSNCPLMLYGQSSVSFENVKESSIELICTPDECNKDDYSVDVEVKFPVGTHILYTSDEEDWKTGHKLTRPIKEGIIDGYDIEFHRQSNMFYKILYHIKTEYGGVNRYDCEIALPTVDKRRNYKKI